MVRTEEITMSMMTLGEMLARFDKSVYGNAEVIFSVNGDYDTGILVEDYLDKDLEKEVDSWMIDFVGFIDSDFGYEPKINVKVWTK